MLSDHEAMATVGVSDLERARRFYGERLGLRAADDGAQEGVALFRSGRARIVVYESQFAGTNQATSVTWGVGADFDAIVASLQKADVPFEHYDLGMERDGDVHRAGDFRAAWFRDPDGNILHINND